MANGLQEVEQVIHRAVRRTGRNMAIFGILIVALGGFMIALHAFEIDSEAQSMSTGALVLLYGFAILFILTGLWMLYVAFFKNRKQGDRFLFVLQHQPELLQEIYVQYIVGSNAPERLYPGQIVPRLASLSLIIVYQDKTSYHLQMNAEHINAVVPYLQLQAPHAMSSS